MNKANYTPFIDPDSGEWIRFAGTRYRGVVWRPTELSFSETGNLEFQVEVLEGKGFPEVPDTSWQDFGKCCGSLLTEIIAAETAEMQQIKEAYEEPAPVNEIAGHVSEMLPGGIQVSDALLPQDIQADLAMVSSVLGGIKPAEK